MATEPTGVEPLDELLPVRRAYKLLAGVLTRFRFFRDFVFDGTAFDLTEDADARTLTIGLRNKGIVPDDAASFGSEYPVLSRRLELFTAGATPTAFVDPTIVDGVAIDALQVAAGQACDLVGTVVGKKRGSVDMFRADVRGSISNNLPTAAVLSGDSVTIGVATGALAAASVAISTDGAGAFVVEVTGVAATNIDWTFAVQVQPVGVPS